MPMPLPLPWQYNQLGTIFSRAIVFKLASNSTKMECEMPQMPLLCLALPEIDVECSSFFSTTIFYKSIGNLIECSHYCIYESRAHSTHADISRFFFSLKLRLWWLHLFPYTRAREQNNVCGINIFSQ